MENKVKAFEMPTPSVFCLHYDEFFIFVEGKVSGPFNSKGAAKAGIEVEKRRIAKRKIKELLQ